MHYWLMKTEPDTYSIQDLQRDKVTPWEGVRNYQARNFMRDAMKDGDLVFIYHSSCEIPGIAGLGRVQGQAHPDESAFRPQSPYFDAKSVAQAPRWYLVDIAFGEVFPNFIPLTELKEDPKLEGMLVRNRGQRLSIQPVESKHAKHLLKLGGCGHAG